MTAAEPHAVPDFRLGLNGFATLFIYERVDTCDHRLCGQRCPFTYNVVLDVEDTGGTVAEVEGYRPARALGSAAGRTQEVVCGEVHRATIAEPGPYSLRRLTWARQFGSI